MQIQLLFNIQESLMRLWPGSFECTKKALSYIDNISDNTRILEISPVSSQQTKSLLDTCKSCRVVAADMNEHFLDELDADFLGTGDYEKLTTVCASMDNLPFEQGEFDIIWSESLIFDMPFYDRISYWKKFAKPGGYVVLTDLIRFSDKPSNAAEAFRKKIYNSAGTYEERLCDIKSAGYEPVGFFKLSESLKADYMNRLDNYVKSLKEEYKNNPEAFLFISSLEAEIGRYTGLYDEYGLAYFILKNPEII